MNHYTIKPQKVGRPATAAISPRRERTQNVLIPTPLERTQTVPQNEKCQMLDAQCSIPSSSVLSVPSVVNSSLPQILGFRSYQQQAFESQAGLQLWLWARQTGKSYTLAAWAIHRLLTRPGRLVTILSNSKTNGIELNKKIADICHQLLSVPLCASEPLWLKNTSYHQLDLSPDTRFETFNTETRITTGTAGILPASSPTGTAGILPATSQLKTLNSQLLTGRIKILAANPRTARGFSGDLILDEFAFHENAQAIWEAAEPILAANPDYQCRIASTPNGKHNLFYQLATNPNIPTLKITRTEAYAQGCPIFHPITRAPITPTEARNIATNKRAYDQNYECAFEDQNMALLTHDLITAAERLNVGIICTQDWSELALNFLRSSRLEEAQTVSTRSTNSNPADTHTELLTDSPDQKSSIINHQSSMNVDLSPTHNSDSPFPTQNSQLPTLNSQLYAGVDVARHHDQTVITVLEKQGPLHLIRAILRLRDMRLPDQQNRLAQILSLPNLIHAKIDMTGLGLGLLEYTQKQFPTKITGINFSSSLPLSVPSVFSVVNSSSSPALRPTVRITEYLATQLLQTYEDHAIHQPIDNDLREDLRKPERLISPSGRVSIAATRDANGHADHFWSLALAIDAAKNTPRPPIHSASIDLRFSRTGTRPGRAHRKHHFHRQ